jgi:hypothetical protein
LCAPDDTELFSDKPDAFVFHVRPRNRAFAILMTVKGKRK